MTWVVYVTQFVVLGLLIVGVYFQLRTRRLMRVHQQQRVTQPDAERGTVRRMTKAPEPIDRKEFLFARMAYLAHLRTEEVLDVETGKYRAMTKAEMIEAINLTDEEHVTRSFDTWDQVQAKQREKS